MRRRVTVVSKEGCRLCEKVIQALASVSSIRDFELRVLDIAKDQKLHDRYWLSIPVVQIDGVDAFDARDVGTGEELREKLERLLRT